MTDLGRLLHQVAPNADIFLSDRDYLLCNYEDIRKFLEQDKTNKMGYLPEERDCDDHSYRLMGQLSIPGWSALSFGILWTFSHALNCFVTENGGFRLVEPQTDQIRSLKPDEGNDIRFITM